MKISGDAHRHDHPKGNDDDIQTGNLFRLLPADEKEWLLQNIAEAKAGVPQEVVRRQLGHFVKADPIYGAAVARAVGLELPEPVEALSTEPGQSRGPPRPSVPAAASFLGAGARRMRQAQALAREDSIKGMMVSKSWGRFRGLPSTALTPEASARCSEMSSLKPV